MTVSSVSLTLTSHQIDVQNSWNQPVQDYTALQNALQAGDLAGAQAAFSALQKDLQTPSQTTQGTGAAGQNAGMIQGGKDPEALANALNSGDLSGAQQAFASLQQDLQSTGRTGRHHDHHQGEGDGVIQSSQGGSNAEQASQISQGARDFEALQSALASGDLAGAQQACASLQQDLQSTTQAGQTQVQPAATDTSATPNGGAVSTRSRSSRFSQGLKDFQALETALSSGDLAGAQQAFASLQQDLLGIGRGRHHDRGHHYGFRHRLGSVSGTKPPEASSSSQTDTTTAPTGSSGTQVAGSTPTPTDNAGTSSEATTAQTDVGASQTPSSAPTTDTTAPTGNTLDVQA
jgi:hypothetical protein